ncbi:Cationic amino acid transporter 4, partial [Cichlidogyrus casuarinus]
HLKAWWAIIILMVAIFVAVFSILVMFLHEQNVNFDSFKVPLVPLLPCLSIFLNICLITKLSPMTWLRFFIWLLIGLIIYFSYGIKNSTLAKSYGESDALIPNEEKEGLASPAEDYVPIDENEFKDMDIRP